MHACVYRHISARMTGVRAALAQPDSDFKTALLQALRWRVVRRSPPMRAAAVSELVAGDLLDVAGGHALFHSLITSNVARQREQFARLLACISAAPEGRTYLMSLGGE